MEVILCIVWSWTGQSGMVMIAVHTCNGMWAVVERVVTLCGPTIVARWGWLWMWLGHVIRGYLDGRNGVGKIPSYQYRRHILGGRNTIPNVCILLLESRRDTTWRRCTHYLSSQGPMLEVSC